MKRNFCSLLLVAAALLTVLLCTAAAADSDFVIEDGVLTGYLGHDTRIVIPDGVTRIGLNALSLHTPEEPEPFYASPNETVTHVTIPASVTAISGNAFMNCKNLSGVTLSEGLLSIGGNAFFGCESLKSIHIPDSVQYIGSGAFNGCRALAEVHLPSPAFVECDSFANTPWERGNATVIEMVWPTVGNEGLTEYNTAEPTVPLTKNGDFTLRGKVLVSYDGAGGEVTIPDGVTAVGRKAFYQDRSVTAVNVPQSLLCIGESAFEGCESLTRVSALPDDFAIICKAAFRGCTALAFFDCPVGASVSWRTAFQGTKYHDSQGRPIVLNADFPMVRSYAGGCPDVTAKSWFYAHFIKAYEAGLIGVKADGSFQPDAALTAGEAVGLAASYHAGRASLSAHLEEPSFQAYCDYLSRYVWFEKDLWKDPGRSVSRGEFAHLLSLVLLPGEQMSQGCDYANTVYFPDVRKFDDYGKGGHIYLSDINLMYEGGICTAYADGKFYPDKAITRAEAAVMAARLIDPSLRASVN